MTSPDDKDVITRFTPDLLPKRNGRQVTTGKFLTLWEPTGSTNTANTPVDRLVLQMDLKEMDRAAGAVACIMGLLLLGQLQHCVVEPTDNGYFTMRWTTDKGSTHDDTPDFIYAFLKEFALISPEHMQEAKEVRAWIRNNFPLPF